jgi:uncharacterized iron-regulated membrane protein
MSFLVLLAVVFGILLLCLAGAGLGIWTGRRKSLTACACDFDADRARARAGRPCDGGCSDPSNCPTPAHPGESP